MSTRIRMTTNIRRNILIVDDDQDVRETLRDYFEHSGFDVFVAGDGDGMRKVLAARRRATKKYRRYMDLTRAPGALAMTFP